MTYEQPELLYGPYQIRLECHTASPSNRFFDFIQVDTSLKAIEDSNEVCLYNYDARPVINGKEYSGLNIHVSKRWNGEWGASFKTGRYDSHFTDAAREKLHALLAEDALAWVCDNLGAIKAERKAQYLASVKTQMEENIAEATKILEHLLKLG